jgi:hypothetical protein
METLRLIQLADNSSSFPALVARVIKETGLSEGKAIVLARSKTPRGKKLYNQWCQAGRPETL